MHFSSLSKQRKKTFWVAYNCELLNGCSHFEVLLAVACGTADICVWQKAATYRGCAELAKSMVEAEAVWFLHLKSEHWFKMRLRVRNYYPGLRAVVSPHFQLSKFAIGLPNRSWDLPFLHSCLILMWDPHMHPYGNWCNIFPRSLALLHAPQVLYQSWACGQLTSLLKETTEHPEQK